MRTSVSITNLHFSWPDGRAVLAGLDTAVGPRRHGLVGLNGCGKSTLLRLVAGDLTPDAGTVTVDGSLAYLPQDPGSDPALSVAQLPGVAEALAALARMDAGDVRPEDFDVIGDDWDVAERTTAELGRLGLDHIELDRAVGSVSGGELMLLSLTALLLRRPSALLLDEPTNKPRPGCAKDRSPGTAAATTATRRSSRPSRRRPNVLCALPWPTSARRSASSLRRRPSSMGTPVRDASRPAACPASWRAPENVQRRRLPGGSPAPTSGPLGEAGSQLDVAEARRRDDREIHVDLPDTAVPAGRTVLTATNLRPPHGSALLDLFLDELDLTRRIEVCGTSSPVLASWRGGDDVARGAA